MSLARSGRALVIPERSDGNYEVSPTLPAELMGALCEGRVVTLFARYSGNGGKDARKACILDAGQLVDDLATFGLDVRHLMPPQVDMDAWLKAAPAQQSSDATTSRPFSNRFVDVWLCPQILLVLSTGTGSKLAAEDLQQPFTSYLTDTVRRLKPVLLYGKRWDRLGRRSWALGGAIDAMKANRPAFVGDETGIKILDDMAEFFAFLSSNRAEGFAAAIPLQTRRGMRSRTGTQMVDGRVAYALPAALPPGLARLRLVGGGVGGSGEVIMCLEHPDCLPAAEHVSVGYPQVLDPVTGRVQDQVANVRWALERLADPTWTLDQIGQGLIARRFSHTKIRELWGLAATARPQPKQMAQKKYRRPAQNVVGPIISNLDVYETGVLTRTLGVTGMPPVIVTNVLPVDGRPWASPEVFAKIRARLADTKTRWASRQTLPLAGLSLRVDGRDCFLRTYSGATRKGYGSNGEPRYTINDAESGHTAGFGVLLSHRDLAHLVAEALDAAVASGAPLPPLQVSGDHGRMIEQTEQALSGLRAQVRDARSRADLLYERVNDAHLNGAMLHRIQTDYNDLVQCVVPSLERDVARHEERLQQMIADHQQSAGTPMERLSALVRCLADPLTAHDRIEVQALISRLDLTLERFSQANCNGWIAYAGIELALRDDEGHLHAVRHQGRLLINGAKTFHQMVQRTRDRLRFGRREPATDIARRYRGPIAEALGLRGTEKLILAIEDPRLARLAFLLHEQRHHGLTAADARSAVAAETGEAPALLARLDVTGHHVHDRRLMGGPPMLWWCR